MTDELRAALREGYATVALPEIVRADMRRFCHVDRTTAEGGTDQHVDPYLTMVNEGKRMAWLTLEARITAARAAQPERQTKAVSDTAETSP